MTAGARALERLYAVAPRDFTRARNALAAELRKSRDADAAREVARLRRPSAPLWAVNQLARHARPALERFLDAVDRLRRTQLSDPRGAMEAMRAERVQLEALVQRAEQALAEVGYAPSAEARREDAPARGQGGRAPARGGGAAPRGQRAGGGSRGAGARRGRRARAARGGRATAEAGPARKEPPDALVRSPSGYRGV